MKAKSLLVASLLGGAALVFAAEKVDTSQLPPAVQKALEASAAGDPVKQITVRNVRGRTVYDIELERKNAPNPRLRIAADGEMLRDTSRPLSTPETPFASDYGYGAAPVVPTLRLDELPAAAQETLKKEAAGREIAKITRDTVNGHSAYAAEFKEAGRNPRVYVAGDGTLLRPTEKPPTIGVGTMFSDTPAQVQQAIRDEIGAGEIVRIDKERRRNEPDTYKVDVKDTRGTFQIRVNEDGKIIENTRATERPRRRG